MKADEYGKEELIDFALWKAWDEEDGDVYWETEIGKGRPGWHIECSCMSMKYLGETLDIHSGGKDLIFPHHENEKAQSEAVTGKKFVNYWLHSQHLRVEGKKMAKSEGNFYILKDLLKKGYTPKAIRYLLLSTHYRQSLNFTLPSLKAAENTITRLKEFINQLKTVDGKNSDTEIDQLTIETLTKFEKAMDDDLNINTALASIFHLIKKVNILKARGKLSKSNGEKVYTFLRNLDKILALLDEPSEVKKLSKDVTELALKRWKARREKDWKTADAIRSTLDEMGYNIEDTTTGIKLKLKSDKTKIWRII